VATYVTRDSNGANMAERDSEYQRGEEDDENDEVDENVGVPAIWKS
jgi:hypothetical protein